MAYATKLPVEWRPELGEGLRILCLTPSFYMKGLFSETKVDIFSFSGLYFLPAPDPHLGRAVRYRQMWGQGKMQFVRTHSCHFTGMHCSLNFSCFFTRINVTHSSTSSPTLPSSCLLGRLIPCQGLERDSCLRQNPPRAECC